MTDLQRLTPAELEVLEFARLTFPTIGHKDDAIITRFRHSTPRFSQRLNVLLDNPAAEEYDPALVRRLRRLRDQRRTARTPRPGVAL